MQGQGGVPGCEASWLTEFQRRSILRHPCPKSSPGVIPLTALCHLPSLRLTRPGLFEIPLRQRLVPLRESIIPGGQPLVIRLIIFPIDDQIGIPQIPYLVDSAVLHGEIEENAAALHVHLLFQVLAIAPAEQACHGHDFPLRQMLELFSGRPGKNHQIRRDHLRRGKAPGPGKGGPAARIPGRVGKEAHRHHNAGRNRQRQDPEPRLPIAEHRLHPRLHSRLPEGQRTGRDAPAADAAVQQRLGIVRPLPVVQLLDRPLVTGQLDVPAQQYIGQPHQRMEPVHGQQYEAQGLPPVVPSEDMHLLMHHHMHQIPPLYPERNVDPGPNHPQHEGGVHCFALEDIVPHDHRRAHQLPQPQIGEQRIQAHGQHAQHPYGR